MEVKNAIYDQIQPNSLGGVITNRQVNLTCEIMEVLERENVAYVERVFDKTRVFYMCSPNDPSFRHLTANSKDDYYLREQDYQGVLDGFRMQGYYITQTGEKFIMIEGIPKK